eukprot:jgi/Tetstr1/422077/TSEL_012937.t1
MLIVLRAEVAGAQGRNLLRAGPGQPAMPLEEVIDIDQEEAMEIELTEEEKHELQQRHDGEVEANRMQME